MEVNSKKPKLEQFTVNDASDIPYIKQRSQDICTELGFDETETEKVAIVTMELASNLEKYCSSGGEISFTKLDGGEAPGLEISSCDKGQGIRDIPYVMKDGISTSNTMGSGLGAVKRFMDEFNIISTHHSDEIHSTEEMNTGTTIVARKWKGAKIPQQPFRHSYITRPMPGEIENGDACTVEKTDDGVLMAVIDGLGHGHAASIASKAAIDVIKSDANKPLLELLLDINKALVGTRGAAIALARLYSEADHFDFIGIGNIQTTVRPRLGNSPYSRPGTIGRGLRVKPKVQQCPWSPGGTLIMYSDGIQERNLYNENIDLFEMDPSIICHRLMYHHAREADDATICVVRENLQS